MTPQQARVVQAEADARATRARLTVTVEALQARLNPATLVDKARRGIVGAGAASLEVAADRPTLAAIGGGIAAILIATVPLVRWRRRRRVVARAARIRGG